MIRLNRTWRILVLRKFSYQCVQGLLQYLLNINHQVLIHQPLHARWQKLPAHPIKAVTSRCPDEYFSVRMCVTLFMGGRPGLAQLAADAQITSLMDKTPGRPGAFNEDKPLCSGDGRVINSRTDLCHPA